MSGFVKSIRGSSTAAGEPVAPELRIDVSSLIAAYYSNRPDPESAAEGVAFGTSGHRGSAFARNFNRDHVLAISQAICEHRRGHDIDGPLFIGMDTHALSEPAFTTALEVLAANGVHCMIAGDAKYTPTPAISHAILRHNRSRPAGLADGIVITPSHNPPDSGGFKYNPPTGGPAATTVTGWIEARANALLRQGLRPVKRMPIEQARKAVTTHRYDYLNTYVNDLDQVVDMASIRSSDIRIGVDPLGGAGVSYWGAIAERFGLNLEVVNAAVDPTFAFMTLDWDGQIRMDPSSKYAMQRLIGLKDRYDVAAGCDPDHDRHGIVVPSIGLMPANHYLAVAIDYLYHHRPNWRAAGAVGKTIVSSQMIDRVAEHVDRSVYEVPVGFKWFVAGLLDGSLRFAGEESAGASFARRDGHVWTTDKDGLVPALLAAEMTAQLGRDPGEAYRALTQALGHCVYTRKEAAATPAQKAVIANFTPEQVRETELAGAPIDAVMTRAPGNNAPLGGLKVSTSQGWFAVRPSGTEELFKLYAESFCDADHLQRIVDEATRMITDALAAAGLSDTAAMGEYR